MSCLHININHIDHIVIINNFIHIILNIIIAMDYSIIAIMKDNVNIKVIIINSNNLIAVVIINNKDLIIIKIIKDIVDNIVIIITDYNNFIYSGICYIIEVIINIDLDIFFKNFPFSITNSYIILRIPFVIIKVTIRITIIIVILTDHPKQA